MKKIILKMSILTLIPIMLLGCGSKKEDEQSNSKLNVTVSISPLKEFTEAIGGEKVEVTTLVPENTEPHDFDFKPKDIQKIMNEKVFIYNGLGMEEWIEDLKSQVGDKDVKFVDSSNGVEVIKEDSKIDPHIWLSLKAASIQSNNIKESLIEADPNNKDYYEENYSKFKEELDSLYEEYNTKFKTTKTKDFVTSHAAFGYLCRDYGLVQKSLADIFGEGEDKPQDKANLIKFCKDNSITTVFSEGTGSQKAAESLAGEINGKVEGIYTLETKVPDKTYIESMKYNLETIYTSMK